ncbi:hypothetical protein [Deinococcus soli (ex Cha et al. 2016)]|uniref:hypothetical protein n=1 Tax=Deinococcus soli (ex Cha et al. 2016) TaxID=1309411 RepID=UPI00166AD08E|nr:hypothetical protein [Deinococcus soli (ex Cha et al. 2016)]GGB60528.1 hypothetical protein GCM10008019_15580 [Deinococcus soli (ex Cha et al. 2016)]
MTVLHRLAAHCQGDLVALVSLLDVLDEDTLHAARTERAALPTPLASQPLTATQLDQQAIADERTAPQLDDLRQASLVLLPNTSLHDLSGLGRRAYQCL